MVHVLEITEDNAHAAIPPYLRPKPVQDEQKRVKRVVNAARAAMVDKVFSHLELCDSGATADEVAARFFEESGNDAPTTNSVAPVLSGFKKDGIAVWNGTRLTRNNSPAHVHYLADNARAKYVAVYGRNPSLH